MSFLLELNVCIAKGKFSYWFDRSTMGGAFLKTVGNMEVGATLSPISISSSSYSSLLC